MKNRITKEKMLSMLYWGVLISFIVPIVYTVYRLIFPNQLTDMEFYRSRADYVLMLLQCVLGATVIHVPMFIQKKFKIEIPKTLYITYIVFLYCAIFLGEIRNFYYVIPHWDDILHCISSIMTGLFGFMCVAILNHDTKTRMSLSLFFISLFAFCFSVTIGAVWEIYEFLADGLLGLNMQKFILEDGTVLAGHSAVFDTMKDIMVDCFGALIATFMGYFSIKNKKGWVHDYLNRKEE